MACVSVCGEIVMLKAMRQNPMIVASILLPLVIVLFFLLATAIPKWLVDPPAHDFLFTVPDHSYAKPEIDIRFDVNDDRLRVRAFKTDIAYRNSPRLYLFEHQTSVVREIMLDLPADKDSFEDGDEIMVSEFDNRPLSTARAAPDGYEVRYPGYRSENLITALFGGRRRGQFSIEKDGAVTDIPHPGPNAYYYNVTFIGWLTD